MNIVFSANNREEVMVLPLVPPNIEIDEPQGNETFEGLSKDLNLIGKLGLRSLSISSIFPVNKKYPFVARESKTDGWAYVAFFRKWRNRKVPLRIVMTTKDGIERLNMPCTVDGFKWSVDRVGDIQYTLDVREYRFV